MKFGGLSDFSSTFVSGGGLFFSFWSVCQRLSIGLVMVLMSCAGGVIERILLGDFVGRGVLRCWFFGVGVDKVNGKGRRDCRRFSILINGFASL